MFAHTITSAMLVMAATFWVVLISSLITSIVACVGSFQSQRRHRWILIAGIFSVAAGTWISFEVMWGMMRSGGWHTFVGLAPFVLGVVSLIRWRLLKA